MTMVAFTAMIGHHVAPCTWYTYARRLWSVLTSFVLMALFGQGMIGFD